MSDFTDELKEKLNKLLVHKVINDDELTHLRDIIKKSTSYEDAYKYATRYGEHLAEAIEELNVDGWLFGSAMEVWTPAIKSMTGDINRICDQVQTNKGKLENIGLKATKPKYDETAVKNLVDRLTTAPKGLKDNFQEYFESIVDTSEKKASNYAKEFTSYANKVVDTTQKRNIDLLLNSGLAVYVKRTYDNVGRHTDRKNNEVCAFCKGLEGTFRFASTGDAANSNVFQRHDNCGCLIDYYNSFTRTRSKSNSK